MDESLDREHSLLALLRADPALQEIADFSFNFNEINQENAYEANDGVNVSVNSSVNDAQNDDDEIKQLRAMPYYDNFIMLIPTTVLPTIGGIHFNTHSGLGFTLRYFDQKFYVMLPSFRVGRVLPINPKNNLLSLRCFKGNRKCKSIHSSLNRRFSRRITFEKVVEILRGYKQECIKDLSAYAPLRYFNESPKKSIKRAIRSSDKERLSIIYDKIHAFSMLNQPVQVAQLKTHLIDVGSQRRKYYETSYIFYEDELFEDSELNVSNNSSP